MGISYRSFAFGNWDPIRKSAASPRIAADQPQAGGQVYLPERAIGCICMVRKSIICVIAY